MDEKKRIVFYRLFYYSGNLVFYMYHASVVARRTVILGLPTEQPIGGTQLQAGNNLYLSALSRLYVTAFYIRGHYVNPITEIK